MVYRLSRIFSTRKAKAQDNDHCQKEVSVTEVSL
jgi:hypothetical protein